ncbi:Asp23/Gls24 family envelope stress response protein [Corynebacterium sp. UBA2622]|uniref:Asp23/Gls24 family envelope stress response protein n=1 Tax=Corynebacterium sp. UBA2622 TaxID=1946393 RepID=UPI0025BB36C4|nr:Asp23/Gls24 family envelope stress response protein [Corynebacterium sp. UBA2622]
MGSSSFNLSERAVSRIAEAAALGVPGCVSLDAKLAGIAGRGLPRVEAHIDRLASSVDIDAQIAASYPSPVVAVTDTVREAVISHVETLTGLAVSRVNVTVANVVPAAGEDGPGRVSAQDVEGHPTFVVPADIRVKPLKVSSPVTRPRRELKSVAPAPRHPLAHPGVPAPVRVRGDGFEPPVRPLVAVAPPPPVVPAAVEVPPPPALRPASAPVAPALKRVVAKRPPRVAVVAARPVVRSVEAPEPTHVAVPRAPRPVPLSPIVIEPVVNHVPAY